MKEYNDYVTKIEEEKTRVEKEADLLNAFQINKMGIWNIDCLQRQTDVIFTKINFDFQNEIDPIVNKIKVYVIFEERNSVVQYFPNEFNKIGIPDGKRVSIVAVLPNNKIAFVENEEIQNQRQKNKPFKTKSKGQVDRKKNKASTKTKNIAKPKGRVKNTRLKLIH